MSRSIIFGLAAIAMMASAAASAQNETPIVVEGTQPAASDKKVCKSEEVVGTRFKKKICRTQAEWLALQQDGRGMVQGHQQNACRQGASSVGGAIQC